MENKRPFHLLQRGIVLIVCSVFVFWQAVRSTPPNPHWVASCAIMIPMGLLYTIVGCTFILRRGPRSEEEQDLGETKLDALSKRSVKLDPGQWGALTAGYISIFTILGSLGLTPIGFLQVYRGQMTGAYFLAAGTVCIMTSWWLLRFASRSINESNTY